MIINNNKKQRVVFLGSYKPTLVFLSYKDLNFSNITIILDESLITLYDYFNKISIVHIFSEDSLSKVFKGSINNSIEI